MAALKLINDVLMFLVELAMLALLGYGGYEMAAGNEYLRWVLGVGLPAAAIAIWSWKLAPKSGGRLQQPYLAAAKITLFIIAAFVGTFWNAADASAFIFVATLSVIGEYALGSNSEKYRL